MFKHLSFFVLLTCIFSVCLSSCDNSSVYDNIQDLDSNSWTENKELSFDFTISDTTERYTLLYSLRYDNTYPYYNLYINRTLEDSTGKFLSKKVQGMDLFNPTTGTPLGGGIGAKKDYLIIGEENYKFPYQGRYTVKLKQYMRQESLSGISAVGFRIEKSSQE